MKLRSEKVVDIVVNVAAVDKPARFGTERYIEVSILKASGGLIHTLKLNTEEWRKATAQNAQPLGIPGVLTTVPKPRKKKTVEAKLQPEAAKVETAK